MSNCHFVLILIPDSGNRLTLLWILIPVMSVGASWHSHTQWKDQAQIFTFAIHRQPYFHDAAQHPHTKSGTQQPESTLKWPASCISRQWKQKSSIQWWDYINATTRMHTKLTSTGIRSFSSKIQNSPQNSTHKQARFC